MNKFLKIIMALTLSVVMVTPLAGCSKTSKLNIELSVYNVSEETAENVTLTFNLYKNLAPNAVHAIKEFVKDDLYKDCVFYKQSKNNGQTTSSQIMFGDYSVKDSVVSKNETSSVPEADFEKNGTTGSNLTNKLGYLGLWRNWDSKQGYKYSGYRETISTMYMPTSDLSSSYDNYFCVVGKYATDADLDILNNIISLMNNSDYYTSYTCYYSSDIDGNLVLVDGKAVLNIITTEEYNEFDDEEKKTVYESSKDPQYKNDNDKKDYQYDSYTLSIINSDKLTIKDIKVK